jgi:hypothetical protein
MIHAVLDRKVFARAPAPEKVNLARVDFDCSVLVTVGDIGLEIAHPCHVRF